MLELAEQWNCSTKTISNWCKKLDIETRKSKRERPPYLGWIEGYRAWYHHDGSKRQTVLVHRLVAVAQYGVNSVKNKEVHHRNRMKMDNRPSNLEVIGVSDHKSLHANESKRDDKGRFDD